MEIVASSSVLPVSYPHSKPQKAAESHHHCPDQSYAQNHCVDVNAQKNPVHQQRKSKVPQRTCTDLWFSHSKTCIKDLSELRVCVSIYEQLVAGFIRTSFSFRVDPMESHDVTTWTSTACITHEKKIMYFVLFLK